MSKEIADFSKTNESLKDCFSYNYKFGHLNRDTAQSFYITRCKKNSKIIFARLYMNFDSYIIDKEVPARFAQLARLLEK